MAEHLILQGTGVFIIFIIDQCIDFVNISAEKVISYELMVQNGQSIFRAISEIVRNSVLIPKQTLFESFSFLPFFLSLFLSIFNETQVSNSNIKFSTF